MKKEYKNKLIICKCGCKKEFLKYDKYGRPRTFIVGHTNKNKTYEELYGEEKAKKLRLKRGIIFKGKHLSQGHKQKMGKSIRENAKNNPNFGFNGRHHSERTRQKLREKAKLQFINGMPAETKEKISQSNLGREVSNETRKKIGIGNKGKISLMKGKKLSEITKQKLRKSHGPMSDKHKQSLRESAKNNPNYGMRGKHQSEKQKKKMRDINIGKPCSEEHKQKIRDNAKINPNYSMKGKHLSEEAKQKLRISIIEYIKNNCGGISPRQGRYEKLILDNLQGIIGFSIKRCFYIIGYFLDGYCQELNLAIEVDEEHHYSGGSLRQKDIDKQNNITQALNCNFIRIRAKDFVKNGVIEFDKLNNIYLFIPKINNSIGRTNAK